MYGAILPHNIFLIAFVLHNLTPSQAGSLFFPSIVDLDSAVKYFHSPKFNIAMKSFKQDLSKMVRSVFVDLSLNIASKFRSVYDSFDTFTDNEVLTGTFLLRKRNKTQPVRHRPQAKLESKKVKHSRNNASKNKIDFPINSSTYEALKDLNHTAIGRPDQNKVNMKNSTRRGKSRRRGELATSVFSSNRQRLNHFERKTVSDNSYSQTDQYRINDSVAIPRVTDKVEGGGAYYSSTTISGTVGTVEVISGSPGTTAQSNFDTSKEKSRANQRTSESPHEGFYNVDVTKHTLVTTIIPEKYETVFDSSPLANTSIINVLSTAENMTRERNQTLKNLVTYSNLGLTFSRSPQPLEIGTSEEDSSHNEDQMVLFDPPHDRNNNTFRYQVDPNTSKFMRETEDDNESLSRKSKRMTYNKENRAIHHKKLKFSYATIEVTQRPTHVNIPNALNSTIVNQDLMFENISTMKNESFSFVGFSVKSAQAEENSSRNDLFERFNNNQENLGVVHRKVFKNRGIDESKLQKPQSLKSTATQVFKLEATDEQIKFEKGPNSFGGYKEEKQNNENYIKKIPIHNYKIKFQIATRPRSIFIKSKIKKRAAYDAMMSMIANRWAKTNNEEAETEDTVTDDLQYDDKLEFKPKESINLPTTSGVHKADRGNIHMEMQAVIDPMKTAKYHESSLPYDIHGKISNLCQSFDAAHRKNKTEVLLLDQLTTMDDRRSTSTVAPPPKLKRSFSQNNNRTNKVVKRKSEQKNNQMQMATVSSRSVSETDRLLDIALEQFEDKLKTIIQSSWPRKNLRDPALKSEDLLQSVARSAAQEDLHKYVISTCQRTLDQLAQQRVSEIDETEMADEDYEEEVTYEAMRTPQSAGTSWDSLPVRNIDHFIKTTPQKSISKKTTEVTQNLDTTRKTPSYTSLWTDNLKELVPDRQRRLEHISDTVSGVQKTEKSREKQNLYCPPCVPAMEVTERKEESDKEIVLMVGSGNVSVTSTSTPGKRIETDEVEEVTKSVWNDDVLKDNSKSERTYQPNPVKSKTKVFSYTTKKPNNKNHISKYKVERPPAKDNIMRLDRKPQKNLASSSDAAVLYSQSQENLRKSIENFKKIVRLNWESLRNIKADDGFSIAEFDPGTLDSLPVSNEPAEKTDESSDESSEDESEILSTQSSDIMTNSRVIPSKTLPRGAQMPSLALTPKDGIVNDTHIKPKLCINHERMQQFRQGKFTRNCHDSSKDSPSKVSDIHDHNFREITPTTDLLVTVRALSERKHDKCITTSQHCRDKKEEVSAPNIPKSFNQNYKNQNSYGSETSQGDQKSNNEGESGDSSRNAEYMEGYQNQELDSRLELEKPRINLQHDNSKKVNSRYRYDITRIPDVAQEPYRNLQSSETAFNENYRPLIAKDQGGPHSSLKSEDLVSESNCNSPVTKSQRNLHSVKNITHASQPCNKKLNRNFSTLGVSVGQVSTLTMTPTIRSGYLVKSNNRDGNKQGNVYRKPYSIVRTSIKSESVDNPSLSNRRYYGENPENANKGNVEYHEKVVKYHEPSRKAYPPDESQTYLTFSEETEVGVIKHGTSTANESYFHTTSRSPFNRKGLRKKTKLRVHGSLNPSYERGPSEVKHIASTENFFEKLQSSSADSIETNTEKSKMNKLMYESGPAAEFIDEEAFKTKEDIGKLTPRLIFNNGRRGKGRRFYNRGNRPLSRLYGTEYTTSRQFSSASKARVLK